MFTEIATHFTQFTATIAAFTNSVFMPAPIVTAPQISAMPTSEVAARKLEAAVISEIVYKMANRESFESTHGFAVSPEKLGKQGIQIQNSPWHVEIVTSFDGNYWVAMLTSAETNGNGRRDRVRVSQIAGACRPHNYYTNKSATLATVKTFSTLYVSSFGTSRVGSCPQVGDSPKDHPVFTDFDLPLTL